jgi:hypothetical protein
LSAVEPVELDGTGGHGGAVWQPDEHVHVSSTAYARAWQLFPAP